MKKWSDKTKKIILVTALLVVGGAAVIGIRQFLYSEKPESPVIEAEETDSEEIEVVPETQVAAPKNTEIIVPMETAENPSKAAQSTETVQSIQKNPEKTKDKKPSEPPAEASESKTTKTQPENKEIPAKTSSKPSNSKGPGTPKNGEVKDGKIYIAGFGWVDYNGGGTSGGQADDIYENGNKIGNMD